MDFEDEDSMRRSKTTDFNSVNREEKKVEIFKTNQEPLQRR